MKESKNSGLSTASMVLGIIGISLSLIPIINNIAFILGILATIFGIITLIKKTGKGKSIAGLVLGILAVVITLSLQSSWSKALDETSKELDKTFGNSTEEVLKEDANVTLGEFQVKDIGYGLKETKLIVTVKNISSKKMSYSFNIEAVDNAGKRIDLDYVTVNDLNAGQSQDFEIFTYVSDEKLESMKTAKFKIVEASAY